MNYKLKDLIDIPLLQKLQEKLDKVYSFPSAIIDMEGNVLTAVAWQDICTKFHRVNPECEKECIKSDQYIGEHLSEANPAVSYTCPHGLTDNAIPIIINGEHLGNFFTGQFFLEKPDLEFFRQQAQKYGFDEKEYLEAVKKVPIWTREKLSKYLDFIKEFIEIIAGIGLRTLNEIEQNKIIKESEEKYRNLFNNSSLAIGVRNADGSYVEFNDQYANLLGYSKEELKKLKTADITHPEDVVISLTNMELISSGKSEMQRYEKRYLTKTGEIVWGDVCIRPLTDNSGKVTGIIGAVSDITDRKRIEDEIRHNEEYLKTVINTTIDGFWVVSVDRRIIDVNTGYCKLTGYSKEEFLSMNVNDVEIIESQSDTEERIRRIIQKGSEIFETKHRKKNGEELDIEVSVTFLDDEGGKFVCFCRDITERRRVEGLIKENEKKYRTLVENSTDVIIRFDKDCRHLYVSPSVKLVVNIEPENFIGKTHSEMGFPKEMSDYWENRIQAVYESKQESREEFSIEGKDGVTYLDWKLIPEFDENGDVENVLSISHNISKRKNAELKLKESEEKYRAIVENALESIIIVNMDGELLFANQSAMKTFEIPDLDLLKGKNVYDFLAPDSFQRAIDDFINVSSGRDSYLSKYRCFTLSGKELWVESVGKKIQYQGESADIVSLRDITERIHAEMRLQESEAKYRSLFENAQEGIFQTSLNGEYISVNPAMAKMFGFNTPEELMHARNDIGEQTYKNPKDRERFLAMLNKDGFVKGFEYEIVKKDGETIWVYEDAKAIRNSFGEIIYIEGFMIDITERKAAELVISQNQFRLKSIVELGNITGATQHDFYMFMLNKTIQITKSEIGFLGFPDSAEETVRIFAWSETAMKQCSVEEPYIDFIVKDTGLWGEVIRQRKPIVVNDYEQENENKRGVPKGHVIINNFASIPFIINNKIRIVIAVANKAGDYTNIDIAQMELLIEGMWSIIERRQYIQDLRIAKEKAEVSDKLKTSFLQNLSHEIRTPLNGIMGFSQLLKDFEDLSKDEITEYINLILSSSDRLLGIINDILEISSIDSGLMKMNYSEFSVFDIIQYLEGVFEGKISAKNLLFNVEYPQKVAELTLNSDLDKILQILTNFLNNAIKFTDEGRIELYARAEYNGISISVKDTGIGIDKEYMNKIFERFWQYEAISDVRYGGTGLGLSISKGLADALGFEIKASSELNTGSTFSLIIPESAFVKKSVETLELIKTEIPKPAGFSNLKILVAEDDDINFIYLEKILQHENMQYDWVKNGLEAVEIVKKNKYDIILMDLKMPKMDGFDASRLIKSEFPNSIIIAQTAYSQAEDEKRARDSGCDAFIKKPINRDALLSLMEKFT